MLGAGRRGQSLGYKSGNRQNRDAFKTMKEYELTQKSNWKGEGVLELSRGTCQYMEVEQEQRVSEGDTEGQPVTWKKRRETGSTGLSTQPIISNTTNVVTQMQTCKIHHALHLEFTWILP